MLGKTNEGREVFSDIPACGDWKTVEPVTKG